MVTFITSAVPLMCFLILATFVPFFRANSVHHWGKIFLQFNSLANPALNFYRNKRYRKAALRLLRFGTPREAEPMACMRFDLHSKRHRAPVAFLSFRSRVDIKRVLCHQRSQSCATRTNRGNSCDRYNNLAHLPSLCSWTWHPVNRPRGRSRGYLRIATMIKSQLHKVGRSNSLIDSRAVVETSACQSVTKIKRQNSVPSVLAAMRTRSWRETYDI